MNKKSFLQTAPKHEEILQKSKIFFYNNLGIRRVIIYFTVCLSITKNKIVLNRIVIFNTFFLVKVFHFWFCA